MRCSEEQLIDALTGSPQPMHRQLLSLQLERLQLIDEQIARLNGMIAQALKPHQEAVARLAEVPGFGVDSAQQVIAEVGVHAKTFPSAAQLTSWVGTCPGKEESAEENHNSRSYGMRSQTAEASRANSGTSTSQARLQRPDHSHKSICRVIFDGVARDDSGAMPCLYFCTSVEIFDQHDVAFDSVKAGIDDLLSVRRDIKAASGSSGRPDVHHT